MGPRRPEETSPPELFYNEREAEKYDSNSRMIRIQAELTDRAIELLNLTSQNDNDDHREPEEEMEEDEEMGGEGNSTSEEEEEKDMMIISKSDLKKMKKRAKKSLTCTNNPSPKLLLDVGCGSGLSGQGLQDAGHVWIGCDISRDMLNIAKDREDSNGDVLHSDMGDGLPFRSGVFDGCISISAIQWLCYSNQKNHSAHKRLMQFFSSLFNCLKRGSRAVLQFYPESPAQMELISTCAMKCGFSGGLVVDYPNSTKAKKYFLCLFAGYDDSCNSKKSTKLPAALGVDGGGDQANFEKQRFSKNRKRSRASSNSRDGVKARDWIMAKKDRARKQGKEVKRDSKFTGRKRPRAF